MVENLSLQIVFDSVGYVLPQNAFNVATMRDPARGFPADCAAVASKRGLSFRGAPPSRSPGSSPPDPLPVFYDAVKIQPLKKKPPQRVNEGAAQKTALALAG